MSKLSDKYYNRFELEAVANKNDVAEEFKEDFIRRFEKEVSVMTEEVESGLGDFDDFGKSAIDFSLEYITKLRNEIKKGHGREWAELYADSLEEHPHAFNDAYHTIKAKDVNLAVKELKIHCKAEGGDALYEKHFCYLMDQEEGLAQPGPDEQAKIYSHLYKEQIKIGKSAIFSHEYADLMSDKVYGEIYCHCFARAFEEALQAGRAERHIYSFADKIADYYANRYSFTKEVQYNDFDKYNEAEIIAELKGIEYSIAKRLDNPKGFVEIFKRQYIKTIEPDYNKMELRNTELDQVVLARSLERYHKIIR